MKWMPALYGITAGLSCLVVVQLLVWMLHFRGGFAWQESPSLQFNWHPILMVVSLIVLYGHGNCRYYSTQSCGDGATGDDVRIGCCVTTRLSIGGKLTKANFCRNESRRASFVTPSRFVFNEAQQETERSGSTGLPFDSEYR